MAETVPKRSSNWVQASCAETNDSARDIKPLKVDPATGRLLVSTSGFSVTDIISGNASNTDGTSTACIAAQSAGVKTYITDVTITNTSANNIYVEIKDGSTAKWTFPVPANGGVTHSFSTPLPGTAATAWNFDPSAATTTVYCSMSGYTSTV